jgi:hypothetical protein
MVYKIIDLRYQGFAVAVLLCDSCAMPDGAEDTGKTATISNDDVYACYGCIKHLTNEGV